MMILFLVTSYSNVLGARDDEIKLEGALGLETEIEHPEWHRAFCESQQVDKADCETFIESSVHACHHWEEAQQKGPVHVAKAREKYQAKCEAYQHAHEAAKRASHSHVRDTHADETRPGGALGLETEIKHLEWHKAFCGSQHVNKADCKTFIESSVHACHHWEEAQQKGPVQIAKAREKYQAKCEAYQHAHEAAKRDSHRPAPNTKGKKCSADVLHVCKNYGCPAQKIVEKDSSASAEACDTECNGVLAKAFHTGYAACPEKPEEVAKQCKQEMAKMGLPSKPDHHKRNRALESLVREHYVKCMCVKRSDTEVCYEGSMGLRPGQKWCEFKSPSWEKLMEEADADAKLPTPMCD
eukprot:TRINITY_DN20556_c0_g1_i1.p1 TRINITY_DN20556_c0_g1~~TRINITY_DN20556_c0_g1_i1.p1  ORF type:complete len:354 (-),score=47.65 TRINITY_DN20556_c0_g1_i1:62-1123(-)